MRIFGFLETTPELSRRNSATTVISTQPWNELRSRYLRTQIEITHTMKANGTNGDTLRGINNTQHANSLPLPCIILLSQLSTRGSKILTDHTWLGACVTIYAACRRQLLRHACNNTLLSRNHGNLSLITSTKHLPANGLTLLHCDVSPFSSPRSPRELHPECEIDLEQGQLVELQTAADWGKLSL